MSIPFWFTLLLIILVQMAAEIGAMRDKEPADSSSKLHRPSTSSTDGHERAEHNRQQDRQQPLQQNSGREGDEVATSAGHEGSFLLTPALTQNPDGSSSASAAVLNWRKLAEQFRAGTASRHRLTEYNTSNQINRPANAPGADWQFRHPVEQYRGGHQHYSTGHLATQTQVNISRQTEQQQHTKDHRPSGAEAGQSTPASGNYRRVLSLGREANRKEKVHRELRRMQSLNSILGKMSSEELARVQNKAANAAWKNRERMIGVAPATAAASRQQPAAVQHFEENNAAIQELVSAITNNERIITGDGPAASLPLSSHPTENQNLWEIHPSAIQERAIALATAAASSSRPSTGNPFRENVPAYQQEWTADLAHYQHILSGKGGATAASSGHPSAGLASHPSSIAAAGEKSNVPMPTLLKLFPENKSTGHLPPTFAPHHGDQPSPSLSIAAEESNVPKSPLLKLFPDKKATGHQSSGFTPHHGDLPSHLHIAEPDPTSLGGADHGTSLHLATTSIRSREHGQLVPESLSGYHHLHSAGVGVPSENPSTSEQVELQLFPQRSDNEEFPATKKSRKE